MNMDRSQISGTRFMFTIICFLQSSALLTSFLSSITKQDSWLPVLFSIVFTVPLILVYRGLMVAFPDKTLLGMFDAVYGPVLGKILGICYVWYFLILSTLNLKDLGDFTKLTVMSETPEVVLMLLCVFVVIWAIRHGLKVVTRYSALFTFVQFFIVIISIIFMFREIDFKNFLPVFDLPTIQYVQATHIMMTIPVGELVVLLMMTPCVKLSKKAATKYWLLGVGAGMLTLMAVLLRDIGVLGNVMHMFTLPGLVSMRLVSLGEALSRVEILFAVALMMLMFFKVTILCYAATIGIAHLFKTKDYQYLALVIGIFVVIIAPILYPNGVAHMQSARKITPFMWTPFEIILPLLTLILAKIRKLPKKEEKPQIQKQEVQHAWDGS